MANGDAELLGRIASDPDLLRGVQWILHEVIAGLNNPLGAVSLSLFALEHRAKAAAAAIEAGDLGGAAEHVAVVQQLRGELAAAADAAQARVHGLLATRRHLDDILEAAAAWSIG